MIFQAMSDQAIAAEIGRRIEQLRLERNITQQQLADEVGLSRVSYGKLAKGHCKFVNLVGVLRALDRLDLLEQFIPDTPFSPMEQLKLRGKKRQRASGSSMSDKPKAVDQDQDQELDW